MSVLAIDLEDAVSAGSVERAIIKRARETGVLLATPEATGGQTFTCSGPGSGWQRNFDVNDYAMAAILSFGGWFQEDSEIHPSDVEVLNPVDGRLARGVDEYGEDGEWTEKIEWSDESEVWLLCPTADEAIENIDAFEEYLSEAYKTHNKHANFTSEDSPWKYLLKGIMKLSKIVDEVDTRGFIIY